MMNKEKIINDVSRMASGAATVMTGFSKQIKSEARTRVDEWGQKMDFVPREDFERLEAVVQDLSKKVSALETPKKSSAKPVKKTATKKTTAKKKTAAKPVSKKTPAKKAAAKTKTATKAVKKKASTTKKSS